MSSNSALVAEELEVISSIYGDDWAVIDENTFAYTLHPRPEGVDAEKIKHDLLPPLIIRFHLLDGYPLTCVPLFQFENGGIWWQHVVREFALPEPLDELCASNDGEAVLFTFIEAVREYVDTSKHLQKYVLDLLQEKSDQCVKSSEGVSDVVDVSVDADMGENVSSYTHLKYSEHANMVDDEDGVSIDIVSGEPFTIKKSTFQAHSANVHSSKNVSEVLQRLLENKKIQKATHNMYAYRIYDEVKGVWLADCDDDGEQHAGSRLAHLLDMQKVQNVLVVVSRWYGILGMVEFN
eukprot:CFRG7936T1